MVFFFQERKTFYLFSIDFNYVNFLYKSCSKVLVAIYQSYFTLDLDKICNLLYFTPVLLEITRDTVLGPILINFPNANR